MKTPRLALLLLVAGCQCPREQAPSAERHSSPPAQLPDPHDPLNRRLGAGAAVRPVDLGSAQVLPAHLVNRRMPGLQFADEVDADPPRGDAAPAPAPAPATAAPH